MINIAVPGKSIVIKYSINETGKLTTYSLNPKLKGDLKLTDGNNLSSSIVPTDFATKDYQNTIASLPVSASAINVSYISLPKTSQKPNKFEVSSKRLLFND